MLATWLVIVQIVNEDQTGAITKMFRYPQVPSQQDALETRSTESTSLSCKNYLVEVLVQDRSSASKLALDTMVMVTRTEDPTFRPGNAAPLAHQRLGQDHEKSESQAPQHRGHLVAGVVVVAVVIVMATEISLVMRLLHLLATPLLHGNKHLNHLLHLAARTMVMATTLAIAPLQATQHLLECQLTTVVEVSHRLLVMRLLQ
jgi:hypothetical protein